MKGEECRIHFGYMSQSEDGIQGYGKQGRESIGTPKYDTHFCNTLHFPLYGTALSARCWAYVFDVSIL